MSKRGKPPTDGDKDKNDAQNEEGRKAYEAHRAEISNVHKFPSRAIDNPFRAKKSAERCQIILQHLRMGYSQGKAADEAGIHRRTLLEWRQKDAEFNEQCIEAIERGTDLVEDEARRRAVEGVDEPVFQQGQCIGFKRVYSDTLMVTLLAGRRPQYAKRNIEHSGPNGSPIPHKIEVEFVEPEESK